MLFRSKRKKEQYQKENPPLKAVSQHNHQPAHQDEHHIDDEADGESASDTAKIQRGGDLEHKIQVLEKHLLEIQVGGQSQNKDGFNLQSSFSYEILNEPVSNRFKMSAIKSFDGSTDPMNHIEGYRALMTLQGASDVLLCIVFFATLKKAVRE